MNNDKIQEDVRNNKIKEGMLQKQSRHLKQWKDRWIVLTKSYLYTFAAKGQYKDPTQMVSLNDIETLKSYYKDQYKRQYTFRVQSGQIKLHMSAKSGEEKWAWMTAIQKCINRIIHPQNKPDSFNMVRQTIRMSSAVRNTFFKKQSQNKINLDFSDNIMKKMKLNLQRKTVSQNVLPFKLKNLNNNSFSVDQTIEKDGKGLQQQEETFFIIGNSPSKKQKQNHTKQMLNTITQQNQQNKTNHIEELSQNGNENQLQKLKQQSAYKNRQESTVSQEIVQPGEQKIKIVEKIVQVPVQKIVEVIVKVPEIREVIVEKQKIIYKDSNKLQQSSLSSVLKQMMINPGQNPTSLINFIVYLLLTGKQKYQAEVLQFCLDIQTRRFFSQVFLLMMNQQIEQENLNNYLKFILFLYETTEDYFYSSDVKALISILLRQIQMSRSELNQHLIMLVLESLSEKNWWEQFNYRRDQLISFIKEIQAVSQQENQFLASRLLEKL